MGSGLRFGRRLISPKENDTFIMQYGGVMMGKETIRSVRKGFLTLKNNSPYLMKGLIRWVSKIKEAIFCEILT
jgi:hypothetical protein